MNTNYIFWDKVIVSQSSNGQDMTVDKIIIKGTNSKTSKVFIQASMHASEIQGNAVILNLIEHFKKYQPKGDITIIPQCNPINMDNRQGAGHQGRFDSASGDNWNRYYFMPKIDYKSFVEKYINSSVEEYKKAFENLLIKKINEALADEYNLTRAKRLNHTMQRESLGCDIVLDLHTDTDATTYLYTAEHYKENAEKFGYEDTLVIPNEFTGALDEAVFVPWRNLQLEFIKQGRNENALVEGYTLELGSEECIKSNEAEMQTQGILNYLHSKNIIAKNFNTDKLAKKVTHNNISDYHRLCTKEGGLYEWFVKAGDIIKEGDIIGQYIQTSKMIKKDFISPITAKIISIHGKGALPQGSQIFNLTKIINSNL